MQNRLAERFAEHIQNIMPVRLTGTIVQTQGMMLSAAGFPAPVGSVAEIQLTPAGGGGNVNAEVIGFKDDLTLLYPYSDITGVRRGTRITLVKTLPWLKVGENLLGRVVNAEGKPVDGKPVPVLEDRTVFDNEPPIASSRPRINKILSTGVRAIDGMLTCGAGQRLGIFAGSGVGKSVTLGMIARYTEAEVIVIGLIGERGRELNDFIERDLGDGIKKSVVVVATSNEPALMRVRAPMTAMAIAEYFRDQGKNVLVMMDSLTRFAMAQREIGLAAGEPPTTKGYPPSVFGMLPRLVERAGRSVKGTITAFFTVLVEGDDHSDIIGDTVRGLLDGHIWLSRKLSTRGHYPAIDPVESISRLMPDICDKEHLQAARAMRRLLGAYLDKEDVISIGAYQTGSNPDVDKAIKMKPAIDKFLQQNVSEPASIEETKQQIKELMTNCS
ncbi:MAG: FliI/YscN family ATPase [Planctomycetaceae bacterium]|jgi:flagellum-specific ATP synthase|nr:FliI/YscN family ATPase [Planctomycetaceae bacterium]